MQQLVEDVSGRPFARLLEERVLAPLEMAHSTYEQPLPAELRDEAATGYRRDGSPVPGRFHTYPERAAAGLWTTPTDLARWAIAIQAALAGGEHPVLERETVRRMVTPDDVGGMGLGPALPEGATFFAHGGANEGFRCLLTAQLDGDEGIVVMTNSDLGSVVAGEVVRTVARERGWNGYRPTVKRTVDLSETERRRLVGVYVVPETPSYTIDIVEEDGELIGVQRWDDQRMRLAAESPSRLFDRRDGTEVQFDLDDDGGPAARFEVQGYRFERTEDGD
jgi:CubicO group peptidase (beta-lactamase class C family)